MTLQPQLRSQLGIKGWIIGTLALGFIVSVTIPKLAIMRLGESGYGLYGLLAGFSSVLAFADLGLIPGITRGLAKSLASEDKSYVEVVLSQLDRMILVISGCLSIVCIALIYFALRRVNIEAIHAFAVFAVGAFYVVKAEVRCALVRVSGRISESYWFRALYLCTNVLVVIMFYRAMAKWPGIWPLCYAQLAAGLVYYISLTLFLQNVCRKLIVPTTNNSEGVVADRFWGEAWRLSTPERMSRVLQLVAGAMERPLLIATAGFAMVTSYDLLMRLMMFVSAVPGALSQPLLAMLMHDAVRTPQKSRFHMALRLTRFVGLLCSVVGLLVALVAFVCFHQKLFHIQSRIPFFVALLVAVVAAVNVQTAPGSAALLARGRVGPLNQKIYTEAIGMMLGGVAAIYFHDGLIFVIVRNVALGLSAVVFLRHERKGLGCNHEYAVQDCCLNN